MSTELRRLRVRQDTAAALAALNRVYAAGEPVFESDTGLVKVANGVTAWNDLPYIGGGGGAGALADLSDVDLDGLAEGDLLRWDGEKFVPHDDGTYVGAWEFASGLWYPNGVPGGAAVAATNNRFFLARYLIPKATSIQALGCRIGTGGEAGSTMRFVIYEDNAGLPDGGDLLVDSGTVAATGTGGVSKAASGTVQGAVWIGGGAQAAPTTAPQVFRANGTVTGWLPLGDSNLATAAGGFGCRYFDTAGDPPAACPASTIINANFPLTAFQVA